MTSKEDRLSSRCVSQHPSFKELEKDGLASHHVLEEEDDDTSLSESFSFMNREYQSLSAIPDHQEAPLQQNGDSTIRNRNVLERRVSFTSLEIREYPVVPGDHPQCSSGCPIELGWEYNRSSEHSLDDYELVRNPTRRHRDQLRLSVQERESLLSANDVCVGEVRRAARRHHRTKSCEGRICQRNMQTFFSSTK